MEKKRQSKELMAARIKRSKSAVFLRKDFEKLGSISQVGRALKGLENDGLLINIGRGVYAKARPSTISGRPVPVADLLNLALEALRKLGVAANVGKDAQALREGKSTQVPMLPVVNVGKSRVRRKISYGSKTVVYEKG